MPIRLPVSRLVPLVALVASAAACSDSAGSGNGRVSVLLTDAPGDVKKAVVTIDQVYLQGGDGRVVLRSEPVTTDLLTLANSTADLVKDAVVPAGRYAQLRFVISGGYIEVDNGDGTSSIYASSPSYAGLPSGATVSGELQMPSYSTSGYKVKLPGDGALAIDGDAKVLLVDFDVQKSFGKAAGASGRWVMSPVATATDFQLTGSLTTTLALGSGVTLPAGTTLGGFTAVLKDGSGGEKPLAFTDANGDGTFEAKFGYVVPGSYTVDVTGPTGVTFATNPAHPASVTVGNAQQATQAFTITSASQP